MGEMTWTAQQQAAINARDSEILVSAAAGSGKTAVLTQRVIKRILEDNPPTLVDRLLVVTFTKASALEMRQRIESKLIEKSQESPDNKLIRQQLSLLQRAPIGTIHSFCLEILKQNFHLAGLPVNFRIGDKSEISAMEQKISDEIIEQEYATGNQNFLELADIFSGKIGDSGINDAIFKILSFARANPFYEDMLQNMNSQYENCACPQKTVWADVLFDYAKEIIENSISICNKALEITEFYEDLIAYQKTFQDDKALFEHLQKLCTQRDWDALYALLTQSSFSRIPSPKAVDQDTKEKFKAMRETIKDNCNQLKTKVFCCTTKEFGEDIAYVGANAKCLFDIALRVDKAVFEEKCQNGVIDFSDLEQMTLKLLVKNEKTIQRTSLAMEIAENYDEIMIDEYQDVNAVQEMLLWAVSKENNRFMVGDVKQSIYSFRQAMPEIFIKKLEMFEDYNNSKMPQRILLNGSFRSRKLLTQAINSVFSRAMSKEAGEIDYDQTQALVALSNYDESSSPVMEIELIDQQSLEDKDYAQAMFVGQKIKSLLDEKILVGQSGNQHIIQPKDIAILMRAPYKVGMIYAKALKSLEIEATVNGGDNLFETLEVMAVINLLKALSNPAKDFELAGAMMSPLFGFSDEEMAVLKIGSPNDKIYTALAKQLAESKYAQFLRTFNQFKMASYSIPVYQLLGKIYLETGYDLKCLGMKNGKQKQANLNLLIQIAKAHFEKGNRGITSFVKFAELLETKQDAMPSAAISENLQAVAITSIHGAKGLEWPIVILCDSSKPYGFIKTDMIKPYTISSKLGFSCVRRDRKSKKQYPTMQLLATRVLAAKSGISEELRLLYVAATRAKERLIITAIGKNYPQKCENLLAQSSNPTPYDIKNTKSYMDVVLLALSGQNHFEKMINGEMNDSRVKIDFCTVVADAREQKPDKEQPKEDRMLLRQLEERIAFKYKYSEAEKIPAKAAASKIADENLNYANFVKKPQFCGDDPQGGAYAGTVAHKFLQLCDFRFAYDGLQKEVDRLTGLNIITAAEAAALNMAKMEAFFQSSLFKEMVNADEVLREYRFMAKADCSEISKHLSVGDDDWTMVEGICDCVIIKGNTATVVDYKTDRVNDEGELIRRYANQIRLYRDMLKTSIDIPVAKCSIYSFEMSKEIVVWENR